MDLGLRDKVGLVAASSMGLGFAVAEELAAEGAKLIMCARGEDALIKASDSIAEKAGVEVLAVAGDLSNKDGIDRIVAKAIEKFGRVDILITNTGGPPSGTFDTITANDWEAAVRGLLYSVVEMTRLVLPGMKKRGWGRILNVTSIAAKQPVDNLMLSNSLRAAVTGFAKTLATEVAPFGITVNNILPGYTATERVEDLAKALAEKEGIESSAIRARWESEIPMQRLGRPEELAALAAFLVSERAGYITGSSIAADGGWIRSLF
ncbi:MAG: SDR family oxidoreductase [Acidobacteria bacterium]|nr:SDR family oxidoreductase [Acidobacteriota bacterium]